MGDPILSLVHPSRHVQLLTTSPAEAADAQATHGFGAPLEIGTTDTGTTLERCYHPATTDFVYVDPVEAAHVGQYGYDRHGVTFDVCPAGLAGPGAVRLHRWLNPTLGVHRMLPAGTAPTPIHGATWVDEGPKAAVMPPASSPPVLYGHTWPDTQQEVLNPADPRMGWRGSYTASERPHLLLHVGDGVSWPATPDNTTDVEQQWTQLTSGLLVPHSVGVPICMACGNHDGQCVVGSGYGVPPGSAHPGWDMHAKLRETPDYDRALAPLQIAPAALMHPGRMANLVAPLTTHPGWWVAALELWPRPAVLDWLTAQLAALPAGARVILVTHMWLDAAGQLAGDNGGYGDLSPRQVWAKLGPLGRVVMVHSGHVGTHAETVIDRAGQPTSGPGTVCLQSTWHADTWTPVRTWLVEGDVVTSWVVDAWDRRVRHVSQHRMLP